MGRTLLAPHNRFTLQGHDLAQVAGGMSTLRIVVADDNADNVATITAILHDEGHEVMGVYTGQRAVAAVALFDPDVVLLDIAMPDMSGWEAARRMREMRGPHRPMLIGISGRYTKSADKILGDLAGFDRYLTKPYDTDALLALLAPPK